MILPGRKYKIVNGNWLDTRSGQNVVDPRDIEDLNERAGFTAEPKKYDEAIKTNKQMLDVDPGNKDATDASKNLLNLKNQEISKQLGIGNNQESSPVLPSMSAIKPESQSGGGYIENADGTGRISIEDILGLSPSTPTTPQPQAPGGGMLDSVMDKGSTAANVGGDILSMLFDKGKEFIGDHRGDIGTSLLKRELKPADDLISLIKGATGAVNSTQDGLSNIMQGIDSGLHKAQNFAANINSKIESFFSSPQEKQQAIEIVKQEKAKGRTDEQIAKDLDDYFNGIDNA